VTAVVVGRGPAGLMAASLLVQAGVSVTVVADSEGTLPLWGGQWDFANGDAEGPMAQDPWDWWRHVPSEHPGAAWSPDRWRLAWETALTIWRQAGIPMGAKLPDRNRWTLSASGRPRRVFLAPEWQYVADTWEPLCIAGFDRLVDAVPEWVAAHYRRATALPVFVTRLPAPPAWRPDWSPVRWARYFDESEGLEWLVDRVVEHCRGAPADWPLVLPQVLGLERTAEILETLRRRLGRPVFEWALLPPALGGMRVQRRWDAWLRRQGVAFVHGRVVRVDDSGCELAGGRRIPGEWTICATGAVLGGGLRVRPDGTVWETFTGACIDTVNDDNVNVVLPTAGRDRRLGGVVLPVGRQVGGCDPDRHGDGGAVNLATSWAAASRIVGDLERRLTLS
jgi:glycerol-3-phosphate dehydrogenase subunit B